MDGVEAACSLASWAQRLSELALGLMVPSAPQKGERQLSPGHDEIKHDR